MPMRRSRLLQFSVFIVWLAAACSVWAQQTPGYELKVLTDRPDALYHANDPVTFDMTLLRENQPVAQGQVEYIISNDGEETLDQGSLPVTGESLAVTGRLDKPGFLRCQATYTGEDGKKYLSTAGAGVDPLDIRPSLPVPDDFDAFWSEKKKELAAVPMNPVLTPVDSSSADIECFDLQLDCLGGAPVSGYYMRPKAAQPKSLPALLSVHGAGVRSSNKPARYAELGMLALDINAHGIPNGKPAEFYQGLAKGELANYRHQGRESRETYYFLGMYLRLIRAMEFLMAQPQWDGKELIVIGSSQGGGQSLVAAGLNPRVTALAANVPAMCEHTGRVNGWPRLVPRDEQGNPDPQILEAARYFDAMNFAARTQADAVVTVGFIDNTCRPTSVYAAYNNLRGPKRIVNEPLMKHESRPSFTQAADELIRKHIQKAKP